MLHPFFSYFGSKYRLAKYYPKPKHGAIIEPFAGSAGYSLLYPDREIILYEVYDPIVELWQYLTKVTEKEILGLPLGPFTKENPIDNANICDPAKTLLGFWNTQSQTHPSRYPLSKSRGNYWSERKRQMLASQLYAIRHWKIEKASFDEIPQKMLNRKATWFIDPPYEEGGKRYRFNKINYEMLGNWCKSRNGQVIVCEQDKARWLEFKPLKAECRVRNASNDGYKELVWYNEIPRLSMEEAFMQAPATAFSGQIDSSGQLSSSRPNSTSFLRTRDSSCRAPGPNHST